MQIYGYSLSLSLYLITNPTPFLLYPSLPCALSFSLSTTLSPLEQVFHFHNSSLRWVGQVGSRVRAGRTGSRSAGRALVSHHAAPRGGGWGLGSNQRRLGQMKSAPGFSEMIFIASLPGPEPRLVEVTAARRGHARVHSRARARNHFITDRYSGSDEG